MDYATALTRLRLLLADPDGAVWPDNRLTDYLGRGQNEYARQTGCLRRSFEICPELDGSYRFPPNYLRPVYGLNSNTEPVRKMARSKVLEITGDDDLAAVGVPDALYELGAGQYGVYPVPDQEPDFPAFDDDYGILEMIQDYDDDGSGYEFRDIGDDTAVQLLDAGAYEMSDFWGVICSLDDNVFESEWGTVRDLTWFTAAATIWHQRLPDEHVWEIGDYLAAVYYAAALAYEEQIDRRDTNFAAALRQMAAGRMAERRSNNDYLQTDQSRWF